MTGLLAQSVRTGRLRMRWVSLLLVLAVGCGPAAGAGPVREYAGPLGAPSGYATDFAMDHQITAVHAEGSDTFRALVEKRGDALVMVALGPHGSRAFTLAQEGDEVRFESHLPRELPFPARFILIDVHRTWLIGLDAPREDGSHERTLAIGGSPGSPEATETLTETWADGRLQERAFRRPDLDGAIRVTYEGGLSPDPAAPPPARVELDNGWLGYRLVMENISRRAL
jgi:hypothetical protein